MSVQMLEVPLLGVGMSGAPSRKGCVVNGQNDQGKQQTRTPLLKMPPLTCPP